GGAGAGLLGAAGGARPARGVRSCLVVTADRELRQRAEAHGARCSGPRTVRPLPPTRRD
ncbi:NTP pyrophosphohydrolase, partial [Streptomyces sp. NPDC058193]